MLKAFKRKSFLALYLSVLRPCFVMAEANLATSAVCSSGSADAGTYYFSGAATQSVSWPTTRLLATEPGPVPRQSSTWSSRRSASTGHLIRPSISKSTSRKTCCRCSLKDSSPPDADKYSVAYVTVPNNEVAKTLAHGLVKQQLAACVNIIPQVTSVYMWKGEINEDSELLLMIKTRTSQVDQLTTYVRSNHPHEVCEVISLPIKNGNPPYLKWIGETVPETETKVCQKK